MSWEELSDELLTGRYIDFNTAWIGQTLNVELTLPTVGRNAIDMRSANVRGWDLRDVTERADSIRDMIAEEFNTDSEKVYLGKSATHTLEFFLRGAKELRSASKVMTTNREYGSMEKVLQNKNYFDEMTWPAGEELLYKYLYARHSPGVPKKQVEQRKVEEIKQNIPDDADAIMMSYITHDTGEILPIQDVTEAAEEKDAYSIIDAAQAAFHIPLDYEESGADLMVGSLHKYGHCLNTLGFGIWDGEPIIDTVHEPEYFLPRHREKEAFDVESTAMYNGPEHIHQITVADAVLDKREDIGWDEQYLRIDDLGEKAEDLLGGKRESPGMVFLDEDEDLERFLEEEYNIGTTYKESTDKLRVSLSPFNTEFEIEILGRAIDAYKNDQVLPDNLYSF